MLSINITKQTRIDGKGEKFLLLKEESFSRSGLGTLWINLFRQKAPICFGEHQKGPLKTQKRGEKVFLTKMFDALMERRDIIRRAFRGTGVGIDVEGKEKNHVRFPGFETYKPPEADEEHNDELLSDAEIKALAKQETQFQEAKRKRKREEKEEAKKQRAIARLNKI